MIPSVPKISVLYRDTPVGTLQMDAATDTCVFEYDRQWLVDGFSLSPTELPLREGLFHADTTRFGGAFAIFEDSLPDGYGLYLLNKMLLGQGTSLKGLTHLQRLSIIGRSGMGALAYLPVLPGFSLHKENTSIEALDALQAEAIKVLAEKGEGDASLLYYNSANSGGARPKIALRTEDGSHWLVKFRHTYDPPTIGRTEYLYMKTAEKCGITIPPVRLIDDKYFAIKRFDIDDNGRRLHIASAAALLKTDFRAQAADYTQLLALTGYLTQDPAQVEEMFRRMVFNIVCINKDDHAKNFSFLCRDGKWELAPAYDITYSPAGSGGEHATSVFYHGAPTLGDILKAGTGIRIPEARCREIVASVEAVCKKELPQYQPF